MLSTAPLIQESLERSKTLNLEGVIRRLGTDEEDRYASRVQIEYRRATLEREIQDAEVVRTRLERILQGNDLTDIGYLGQGIICSRAVCRVEIRAERGHVGYGTGFLVAPGVMMTNHHVLESEKLVRYSRAQFRYERNLRGVEVQPVEFALRSLPEPILYKDLDIAIVAVEPRSTTGEPLDQFGWLKLSGEPGKAFIGEYLTIIQHPGGERKQICVRENKLLKYSENGPYLWYQTDTVAGSSGSPVFNNSWNLVALHHSAIPKTKRVRGEDVWLARNGKVWTADMGEDQIDWVANEGVRISRIVDYLRSQHRDHPLAQTVLTAGEPRPDELLTGADSGSNEIQIRSDGNGTTRILLPIEIGVKVGLNQYTPATTSLSVETDNGFRPGSGVQVIEKVEIDQTNYSKRRGYDPKFLGGGLIVPLPKVNNQKFGKVLTVKGRTEIKYWNYSVVMNKDRRLAYFSAANVDSAKFRGNRDADGDTWFIDTRSEELEKAQIGREFYKKQATFKKESVFEADRTLNPFDQGHLSRRSDVQWGSDDDEAKRNGDDSYHYSNCAPQHWQFNQNSKVNGIWFRLEESALHTLSQGSKRLCLINGHVFNAPLGKLGSDGFMRLNLKGKRIKDGRFGKVQIPRMFFKVIAYKSGKELRAKAFVVTQEELLTTIDRYYPEEKKVSVLSDLEVRLYRVSLADLEKLTDLDFGSLTQHDAPAGEESLDVIQGRPIEDLDEIMF